MLRRGLLRRCPRCGSRRVFDGWFAMKERCPGCGHRFERRNDEDGFFLGAFVIAFGTTEGAVALCLAVYIIAASAHGGSISVWPAILAGLLCSIGLPLVVYPFSKTVWCAIDLAMHPLDPDERLAAAAACAPQPDPNGS